MLALLLFSVMLLGAALSFAENFERQTSTSRWMGSTAFLLVSIALVSVLLRDLVLRLGKTGSRGGNLGSPGAANGSPSERW